MPRRTKEWRSGQPSLADVAELAGVSAQTVSRVVNNASNVLPETRDKVEAALTTLGYRPHTGARALATGKFGSIGVLCFDLTKFGNLHVVDAAIHRAQASGYGVYLSTVPDATAAHMQAAVRGLTDQAVDGLLVVEARILDTPSVILPADLPVVVAEGSRVIDRASVGVDHVAGGRLAVEHLLDLGHETVHHIAGLPSSHPALAREQAWRATLSEHGRSRPEPVVGDWSSESGYQAALELLRGGAGREGRAVTAIFAANDQMAAGVLRAAAEAGRSVPRDLSIVGYDDAELAAYLTPGLTTVHAQPRRVGKRCIDLLVKAIQGRAQLSATVELITPQLVVRESTAPPGPQP